MEKHSGPSKPTGRPEWSGERFEASDTDKFAQDIADLAKNGLYAQIEMLVQKSDAHGDDLKKAFELAFKKMQDEYQIYPAQDAYQKTLAARNNVLGGGNRPGQWYGRE